MSGFYSYPDFPGASYDQWKTTDPNAGEYEPTPEEEAQEWFDEWFGAWLSDQSDEGYEIALTEIERLSDSHANSNGTVAA